MQESLADLPRDWNHEALEPDEGKLIFGGEREPVLVVSPGPRLKSSKSNNVARHNGPRTSPSPKLLKNLPRGHGDLTDEIQHDHSK